MTNPNLHRFKLLVISFLVSTSMLCSAAQSQPPPRAVSCTSSAASQTGCDVYKVACFCSSSQFSSTVESCVQGTCAASDIQDATDFIKNLCTVTGSSVAVSPASSSNRPFSTAGASQNAAAASLKRDIALLGGALGGLQVLAAIT